MPKAPKETMKQIPSLKNLNLRPSSLKSDPYVEMVKLRKSKVHGHSYSLNCEKNKDEQKPLLQQSTGFHTTTEAVSNTASTTLPSLRMLHRMKNNEMSEFTPSVTQNECAEDEVNTLVSTSLLKNNSLELSPMKVRMHSQEDLRNVGSDVFLPMNLTSSWDTSIESGFNSRSLSDNHTETFSSAKFISTETFSLKTPFVQSLLENSCRKNYDKQTTNKSEPPFCGYGNIQLSRAAQLKQKASDGNNFEANLFALKKIRSSYANSSMLVETEKHCLSPSVIAQKSTCLRVEYLKKILFDERLTENSKKRELSSISRTAELCPFNLESNLISLDVSGIAQKSLPSNNAVSDQSTIAPNTLSSWYTGNETTIITPNTRSSSNTGKDTTIITPSSFNEDKKQNCVVKIDEVNNSICYAAIPSPNYNGSCNLSKSDKSFDRSNNAMENGQVSANKKQSRNFRSWLNDAEFEIGFIDTHCHIDFLFKKLNYFNSFESYMTACEGNESFPKAFEGCVSVFCDPSTFAKISWWESILGNKNIWGAFGCHPHYADIFGPTEEGYLRHALQNSKVMAAGEIGLDYSNRNNVSPEIQKEVFKKQILIALEFKKPIVIHSRDSYEDSIEIMKLMLPKEHIIHKHCFTGDWSEATEWMSFFPNLYLGITCLVTQNSLRARKVRDVAQKMPLERLLLETDAPYFRPHYLPQGQRQYSHPGMAIHVAAEIAKLRNIEINEVLKHARRNTTAVYSI